MTTVGRARNGPNFAAIQAWNAATEIQSLAIIGKQIDGGDR
jgi:hypothetical protein